MKTCFTNKFLVKKDNYSNNLLKYRNVKRWFSCKCSPAPTTGPFSTKRPFLSFSDEAACRSIPQFLTFFFFFFLKRVYFFFTVSVPCPRNRLYASQRHAQTAYLIIPRVVAFFFFWFFFFSQRYHASTCLAMDSEVSISHQNDRRLHILIYTTT